MTRQAPGGAGQGRRPAGATGWRLLTLIPALALLVALLAPAAARAQDDFPAFVPTQRVYDQSGSLTPDELADLERRAASLAAAGTSPVVLVRERDADSDDTLDQVEDLQQAWVAATGADQDTAIGVLINREPGDANSARVGIFVGRTLQDGNLPAGEREEIINDELIPPLRSGDVYGSLVAGLARLESSVVNGPQWTPAPPNAFERWSSDASGSWLPLAGLAAALAGAGAAFRQFGQRRRTHASQPHPTTQRPGDLTPALAGALVAGGPQASALPATVLDFAGRGGLVIEPEREKTWHSGPTIQLRLRDRSVARDDVERAVWAELEGLAEPDGVVPGKQLQKLSGKTTATFAALRAEMAARGWSSTQGAHARGWLYGIGTTGVVLAVVLVFITGIGGADGFDEWLWPLVAAVGLGAVGIAAFAMGGLTSPLSVAGQEAALPWRAYRDGIKESGKDQTAALDLDLVLPDAVALGVAGDLDKRLKAAGVETPPLRIFQQATSSDPGVAAFPFWLAFNTSVTSTSASSSTVSSTGAGGGGGSAGST